MPEPRTSSPTYPASVALPIAADSVAMTSLSSPRTAMNASRAPMALAAMAVPSMTAYGSRMHQRPVGVGCRVGPVAVSDDVSPVGLGAGG